MIKLILTAVLLFLLTACYNQLRLVKVRDHHSKEDRNQTLNQVRRASLSEQLIEADVQFSETATSDGENQLFIAETEEFEINSETDLTTSQPQIAPRILQCEQSVTSTPSAHQSENITTKRKSRKSYFDFNDVCFYGMIGAYFAIWLSTVITAVFVIWGILPWFWILIIPGGFALLSFLFVVLYFKTGGGLI